MYHGVVVIFQSLTRGLQAAHKNEQKAFARDFCSVPKSEKFNLKSILVYRLKIRFFQNIVRIWSL